MHTDPLKEILEGRIVSMFPGSELTQEPETANKAKRGAFLRNQCEMVVRAAKGSEQFFVLRRSQPFDQADADFVECFVERLHAVGDKLDEEYFQDLINPMLRRSVADRVKPRSHLIRTATGEGVRTPLPDVSGLVADIIERFEGWAEETYEGRRIAAAVGVDASNSTATRVRLSDLLSEQFGVVLAYGLETFLKVGSTGEVVGHEPLNSSATNAELFAPLRFCRLAEWAKGPRIGVGLTRNGEILVFAGQALAFAKRRGVWHQFTHGALQKRMALNKKFGPSSCKAVLQTCLDTSFARTGGGITLVEKNGYDALIADRIISEADFVGATGVKGQCLKTIIGDKPFYALDRHLRHDLAAIDGATILNYQGKVLAAGAIVKLVGAGSVGGGARTAAAKTLAKYGLAIKISSDGAITGFKKGEGEGVVEKVFAVG